MKYKIVCLLAFLFLSTALPAQQQEMAPSVAPTQMPQQHTQPAAAQPESAVIVNPPVEAEVARIFYIDISLPAPAELDKEAFDNQTFDIVTMHQDPKKANTYKLGIMAFGLGKKTFGETLWLTQDGKEFKTKPFDITLKRTETKVKSEGLVDIRPPYRPFNPWVFFWGVLGLTALYFIARFFIARAKNIRHKESPYAKDNRPLYIIALEQIDNLLMENLWSEGMYKMFYIRLYDIFRDYLTARFNIDAHKYTSRDLLRKLKHMQEFKGDLKQVKDFQRDTDLVKFAGFMPNQFERDADIEFLRNIIMDTKPETEIAAMPSNGFGLVKDNSVAPVDIKAAGNADKAQSDKNRDLP